MIKSRTTKTKILDGNASLGVSSIDVSSILVDGEEPPSWMSFNGIRGEVSRTDGIANDKTPYSFSFSYFYQPEVFCSLANSEIDSGGTDSTTLTVTCEDTSVSSIVVAVFDENNDKIGTTTVSMSSGTGTKTITSEVVGTYRYMVDTSELDATWNISKYRIGGDATLGVV